MSTPLARAPGSADPYAPKWAREGASRRPDTVRGGDHQNPIHDDFRRPETTRSLPLDAGVAADPSPRSLDPVAVMPPIPRSRPWTGSRGLIALAVSALVALLVVTFLPSGDKAGPHPFPSRFSDATSARLEKSNLTAPRLVVTASTPGATNGALLLGVALKDSGLGAALFVGGLPSGTMLSAGRPVGTNRWRLSAAELDNATIRPPRGFAGTMEVMAELQLAEGTVVERRPLHFEWIGAAPEISRQASPVLDQKELRTLIKRGEDFMAIGDVASARLVLRRAAKANDGRAALALGGTYDANVLEQLGIKGIAPNIALAVAWYEKAKELGSAEAPLRLARLAGRDR